MIDKKQFEKRADTLNQMAAKGVPMPDEFSLNDKVFYIALEKLYSDYRKKAITAEEAKKTKIKLVNEYAEITYTFELWSSGAKAMLELNKLLSPESELPKLSRQQLAEKLIRFQAILNGTMQKYDGEIPKMYDKLMEEIHNDREE